MQNFMPGAQARGTHSFNPGGSQCTSAAQALDNVNAENDGEEDQAGPPVDSPISKFPAAFTSMISPLLPPAPDKVTPGGSSQSGAPMANIAAAFTSAVSSIFPPAPDTVSLGGSSQSDAMPPPQSSSISRTKLDHISQPLKRHVSLRSALSHTTSSDTPTTSSARKHKRDATGDMPQPSSKRRASRNKTETLNPVIISSQLNSTLTRLADVMEKSLDVTATSVDTHPAPLHTSSTPSQLEGLPSTLPLASTSTSDSEVLDKAFGIIAADKDFLSEDDLLAASLFFSSSSDEVVRTARNFIALSNNPAVQHRFLLHQLDKAGLRMGKGKGKAIVNDNDDFAMYE